MEILIHCPLLWFLSNVLRIYVVILGFLFFRKKCHFISGFTETQINFNFIMRKNNLIVFLVPLCSFKKIKILKEKKKKMTKDNTACYVVFLVKSQAVAVVNNLQSSSTPQKKWKYILLAINHWHLFSLIFLETQLHVP